MNALDREHLDAELLRALAAADEQSPPPAGAAWSPELLRRAHVRAVRRQAAGVVAAAALLAVVVALVSWSRGAAAAAGAVRDAHDAPGRHAALAPHAGAAATRAALLALHADVARLRTAVARTAAPFATRLARPAASAGTGERPEPLATASLASRAAASVRFELAAVRADAALRFPSNLAKEHR